MWKTCEGNKWCGSAYEQAYREGYEQGLEDCNRIAEFEKQEDENKENNGRDIR